MYKKYLLIGVLTLVLVAVVIAIISPSAQSCEGKNSKKSACYSMISKYDTISSGYEQYRIDNACPDSMMIDCFSLYVENSASTDAYLQKEGKDKYGNKSKVDAFNKFKDVIDQLLTDVSAYSRTSKCYYINDTIIEYKGHDFARKGLTLDNIKNKQKDVTKGNRSNTELDYVIDKIFKRNGGNEISVLVSDFVPSPQGSSEEDIERYISSSSNRIKGSLKAKLASSPKLCVMLCRYTSEFDGIYYDTNDEHIPYKGSRPFYIMIVGEYGVLSKLLNKSSIMKQADPYCVFFTSQNDIPYGVFSGQLKAFNDSYHKGIHKHLLLEDDTKEKAQKKDGEIIVKLKMDLCCLPCSEEYLLDTANYKVVSDCFYIDRVERIKEQNDMGKYTHVATLKNKKTVIHNNNRTRVMIKSYSSNFREYSSMKRKQNIDNSSDSIKTLGIEPLRQGIEDAFRESSKQPSSLAVFEFLIN